MGFRPGEDFYGGYRQPFIRGLFTSDPAINALIAQVARSVSGPPVQLGMIEGAPLPEVLPRVATEHPVHSALPEEVQPAAAHPVVYGEASMEAIISLLQQLLQEAQQQLGRGDGGGDAVSGAPVGGAPGSGGGGTGGGSSGGSSGGKGASPEAEADIGFGGGTAS